MQSKARTVAQYLKELPADRRAAVEEVRALVVANMDPLLEEGMQYGMISWYVPFSVFPDGYHTTPKQPLPFACLASQKNYLSLYLMSVYADGTPGENWFRTAWAASGKRIDMGKACIRFKRTEDLALDVIAEAFRRITVKDYLVHYAFTDPRNRKSAKSKTVAKTKAVKKKSKK